MIVDGVRIFEKHATKSRNPLYKKQSKKFVIQKLIEPYKISCIKSG